MDHIVQILHERYGIDDAHLTTLEGYANANYRIEREDGSRYVFKEQEMYPGLEEFLLAEGRILERLSQTFPTRFQKPVLTLDGQYAFQENSRKGKIYRMLHWVDGAFFHESSHTPTLFLSAGRRIAEMNELLRNEFHTAIDARTIPWDVQHLQSLRMHVDRIEDVEVRKKVRYFLMQFRERVSPAMAQLRTAIIHNDLNDWNLLVNGEELSGIIDFGDMVRAPIIQDVAVHLAYALFDKEDPVRWTVSFLKGYHAVLPLEELELDLLYYLIAGRICLSLIHSAASKSENSENNYLAVSEQQMVRLLHGWLEVNPEYASREFKKACGIRIQEPEPIQTSLERRFQFIGAVQSVSYTTPIKMTRAAFQYMYDAYGNTFLDAYNNIPHVGHSHPCVVEAGQRQMARLNTNTRYVYDHLANYAERLLSKFPKPLNKVFFVNSGSAASDLAIRMAQTHTGNRNVMVVEHGYHGHTRLGIDISHYKFGRSGGRGRAEYILKTPIPDTYRGEFRQNDGTAGKKFADASIAQLKEAASPIAAFIAEPIVGCAGQVPLAQGYLRHVYPAVRAQGGVCISDEVQTGFGRLGNAFWGFEQQGVVPDIVVLGKPMGNGHPMGAVVTTEAIADSFNNGMEFFSSFGGNPVSCAIGMAVLEVIDEEALQKNALEVGDHFMNLLDALKNDFECIGDVRGSGLFVGVELVKEDGTGAHDPELAAGIKNSLRQRNILVSTDGPLDNIIKMKPPLCFSRRNAEMVVNELTNILKSN